VREEVLACLTSLGRHSEGLELQVIYVDNGSGDGSADAVAAAYPETEIVRLATNEGVPARNYGLRRARGRHRMFLDSDAKVTPGALQTLVDVLDTHPRVGLAGPRLSYPDGGLQLSTRRYPPLLLPLLRRPPLARLFENGSTVRRHLMSDERHDRRRRVEYVIGACQMFRAEAQLAAGEIDRHIWFGHDDADWCFTIRRAGYDVLYVPDAEVVHDYRRSSASRPFSRLAVRFLKAHFYFQLKWWHARGALVAEGRTFDQETRSADDQVVTRDERPCP